MAESPVQPVRVVAIHPVRDFAEFCAQFAAIDDRRDELGVLGTTVHRSVDNPNEVMVTIDMRSADHALAMLTGDDRMRGFMDRAGIDVYPAVFVGIAVQDGSEAS
jgi:hypothetical protein